MSAPLAIVTRSVGRSFALRSEVSISHALFSDFILLVEGFGLDDDGQAVGRTDRPSNARIPDARHREHDLRNMSLRQLVGNSYACPSEKYHVCKLDNSAILTDGLGVVTRREFGGFISILVWLIFFLKESKLGLELHLWVRAREPVSAPGLVDISGDQ